MSVTIHHTYSIWNHNMWTLYNQWEPRITWIYSYCTPCKLVVCHVFGHIRVGQTNWLTMEPHTMQEIPAGWATVDNCSQNVIFYHNFCKVNAVNLDNFIPKIGGHHLSKWSSRKQPLRWEHARLHSATQSICTCASATQQLWYQNSSTLLVVAEIDSLVCRASRYSRSLPLNLTYDLTHHLTH